MGSRVEERAGRPDWRRYGAAVALVAVATALAIVLRPWLAATPHAPFYAAIALAAWYGGLGPSLLAIALSLIAISIWVSPPIGMLSLDPESLSRLGAFLVVSGLIAAVSAGRDRADAALRASERRFRTILETANEGVWLIDRQGRTQYANDRMAALLGAAQEDVAAARVTDFVFAEDAAAARERIGANLAGRAEEFDFRFRRADGAEVLVRAGTSPVRDRAGRVVGALGLFTDVTARRRADNALRLLDAAGRELASSLDYEETLQRVAWVAVPALADWCFVDLRERDGSIRRVAVAYPAPEQEPLAATAMRYPPTPAHMGPAMRSLATGTPVLIERVDESFIATATQDDTHRAMLHALGASSLIAAPLLAGGEIHGTMTLLTTGHSGRHFDADDLALTEQLARRSAVAIQNARLYGEAQTAEARYRGLFEGASDGIVVIDPAGRYIDANPAMTALTGYRREELLAMRAGDLHATESAWSGTELERLRREGSWRGEWELRRKDGTTITVETETTAIRLPSGDVYVSVSRDISERRRVERLHEEFIATVAHDLKNPLTAMRGQTQLLQRRLRRGEAVASDRLEAGLETIDASALQMTTLIDELADVARLRAGEEIELRRSRTDLRELVERAIAAYARTTERHSIRFVWTDEPLIGDWDGPRLERVLGNLLANAIKYSPRGGVITVHLERRGAVGAASAVLSVTDPGVGIPAADLPLVFQRFRRAGNVAAFAGTGIGLAGAKRIVELHGGTIDVVSTEGEGSTFTVRLPLDQPA
jgi:PAS domain S-box-containing protein